LNFELVGRVGLLGLLGLLGLGRGVGGVVKKLWQTLKVCQNVWRIIVVLSFAQGSLILRSRFAQGSGEF